MSNGASIQSTLVSICDQLKEKYHLTNYTESIPQGFKEPCFFVENITVQQKRIGPRRYSRTQAFCVHYFPKMSDEKVDKRIDDCLEMAEYLYFGLEYIEVDGHKRRGSMMNHNISDHTLHFYVNYNYHLIVEEDIPLMENLEQRSGLRNGR